MKFTTQPVNRVMWHDLEEVVQNTYNCPYDFVADEEARNDSVYLYHADGNLSEWHLNRLNEWVASNSLPSYLTYTIINDLVCKKVIPPGYYLVEVSW